LSIQPVHSTIFVAVSNLQQRPLPDRFRRFSRAEMVFEDIAVVCLFFAANIRNMTLFITWSAPLPYGKACIRVFRNLNFQKSIGAVASVLIVINSSELNLRLFPDEIFLGCCEASNKGFPVWETDDRPFKVKGTCPISISDINDERLFT